ncbi:ATP-binding protein [Allohahella marinimesophila]|uniref:AAA+ ATPase domain-containing protein n=1 Tax=Allohahella marinimesophila TaxID=1054972 RepID=A0ABP7Q701_9GAMM
MEDRGHKEAVHASMLENFHYARPALANKYLDDFVRYFCKRLAIYSAPGTGKTQFLINDFLPAAAKRGVTTIYVNLCSPNTSPWKLISDAIIRHAATNIRAAIKAPTSPDRESEIDELRTAFQLLDVASRGGHGDGEDKIVILVLDGIHALAPYAASSLIYSLKSRLERRSRWLITLMTSSDALATRILTVPYRAAFYNQIIFDEFPLLDTNYVRELLAYAQKKGEYAVDPESAFRSFEAVRASPLAFEAILAEALAAGERSTANACKNYFLQKTGNTVAAEMLSSMDSISQLICLTVSAVPNLNIRSDRTLQMISSALGREFNGVGEIEVSNRICSLVRAGIFIVKGKDSLTIADADLKEAFSRLMSTDAALSAAIKTVIPISFGVNIE